MHRFHQRSVLKGLRRDKTAQRLVSLFHTGLQLLREIHLFSVRRKRRGRGIFTIRQQDLHALFGLLQLALPLAGQLDPALKFAERFF